MRSHRIALTFAAIMTAFAGASAHAATEIQFWHSMEGALGDRVNGLVDEFNKKNPDYQVKAVYKGNYGESMNAGIAAFRAGNAPDILQVFEVGTATMMYAKGAIKPVQQMSEEVGNPIDPKEFIGAVAGYYSSADGKLVSMPFNSSTVVFYYNKDAFKKAGLDPEKPPKTWPEVMQYSAKLKASGTNCAYTTDWQGWVHLESFSAWHNTLYATKNNGFGGTDARLVFNSPLHVKHITNLQDMVKKGYFSYGGRKAESQAKFYNGECAMFTGSSASLANIRKNAKFAFAVAQLPYYPDVQGAPQNTIIGGASLWVMGGKKPEEYKGVAKFFNYLSRPEIQSDWHQATGYLPVTTAAYELTKKSGYYDKNPGADVSVQQMVVKTTDKSRGVRLGNLVQIRTVVDEELEAVWAGKKEPKAALDSAVARGNDLLERFQKTARE